MLPLFKRLVHYIQQLQHYDYLTEPQANAMMAMVYVHIQLGSIKQQHDYVPDAEFKLLIDAIKLLSHDDPILPQLLLTLITILDVIHAKIHDNSLPYLEQFHQVLDNCPCVAFFSHHFDRNSPSVQYLMSRKTLSVDKLARTLSFDELNLHVEECMVQQILKNHPTEVDQVKTRYAPNLNSTINAFSRPLKASNYLIGLWLIAQTYRTGRINDTILIEFIETVFQSNEHNRAWDPKQFATSFLSGFRSAYYEIDDYYNKTSAQNRLLHGLVVIISTLDKHLPRGMLLLVYKDHVQQTQTFQIKEETSSYLTYVNALSLILGVQETSDDDEQAQQLYLILQDPQKMYYLLDIISHNNMGQLPYVTNPELHAIPHELQQFLVKHHSELVPEFILFLEHYHRINHQTNAHQQRNITLLFIKYGNKVQQLIEIMDHLAIKEIHKLVANTVLPLEQRLEIIPILDQSLITPLREYFILNVKTQKEIETFKICLIAIGTLSTINLEQPQQQFMREISHDKSPQEFLNAMVKFLLQKLLPAMDIELSEATVRELFQRIPPDKLINLITASVKMEKDQYRDIFLELLKRDLLGENNQEFMHDTNQESDIGRDLARHNATIRTTLLKHGIIPESALEYDKTHEFILLPPGETEQDLSYGNQYGLLWSYLQALNQQILKAQATRVQTSSNKIDQNLDMIAQGISELQRKIDKQTKQGGSEANIITTILSDLKISQPLLKKIRDNCLKLIKIKASLPGGFFEFAEHVIAQSELINSLPQETSNQRSASQAYYFKVEQWSKAKTMTFFLGDEVGCCLATTNAQFQAIVQRRMDDAMLFHVAIDQTTGKPAALIWLYLAITTDNQVVLMANFFEVKTKFGLNDYLRLALLHSLLQFTHQYLNDNPGISGFYMNKLRYGWNEHDLNLYPIIPLSLYDKVGGPYIPGGVDETAEASAEEAQTPKKEFTQSQYYLVSLEASQFHEFSPQILAKSMHAKIIPITELIHRYVQLCVKKSMTFEQLKMHIINQYQVQLTFFYDKPLQTNPHFLDDLYHDYESCIISHQTSGRITTSINMLKTEHAFFDRLLKNTESNGQDDEEQLEKEKAPAKKSASNDPA